MKINLHLLLLFFISPILGMANIKKTKVSHTYEKLPQITYQQLIEKKFNIGREYSNISLTKSYKTKFNQDSYNFHNALYDYSKTSTFHAEALLSHYINTKHGKRLMTGAEVCLAPVITGATAETVIIGGGIVVGSPIAVGLIGAAIIYNVATSDDKKDSEKDEDENDSHKTENQQDDLAGFPTISLIEAIEKSAAQKVSQENSYDPFNGIDSPYIRREEKNPISISSDDLIESKKKQDNDLKKSEDEKQESKPAKAPGIPTENDGFEPKKNWDGEKVKDPRGRGFGYPDEDGKIWIPSGPKGHGGPHWDVQDPKTGDYKNVMPGGHIRGEKNAKKK